MGDVIRVNFRRADRITRADYLASAERNERAAIQFPELSRPFLSLAGQRRRQAEKIKQQRAEG